MNYAFADALVQALPKVGPYERSMFEKELRSSGLVASGRKPKSNYDRWLDKEDTA